MTSNPKEMTEKQLVSADIDALNHESSSPIRQDPIIKKMLDKLPESIASSYSDTQLQAIRVALGDRTWGKHFVDNRGTLAFPFIRWRFFYVFLVGKNKRAYTRREKHASMWMFIGLILSFIIINISFGLLIVYILKSSMGIDLLQGTSLGIWDWFKD